MTIGLQKELNAELRLRRRRLLTEYYESHRDIIEPVIESYVERGCKLAMWGSGSNDFDRAVNVFLDVFDPKGDRFFCVCRPKPELQADPLTKYPLLCTKDIGADAIFDTGNSYYSKLRKLRATHFDGDFVNIEELIWSSGRVKPPTDLLQVRDGKAIDKSAFCSLTILYNPDDDCVDNILSYAPFVETAYVYDNSPTASATLKRALEGVENVEYIFGRGTNSGICLPINMVTELARERGFEWLITFDQDSYADEGMMSRMEAYALSPYCSDDIALIAPFAYTGKGRFDYTVPLPIVSYVNIAIQSGLMHRIEAMEHIGPYDEKLVIDEVDNEYCARTRKLGYQIACLNRAVLLHQRRDEGDAKGVNKYSPLRFYYRTRNMLAMQRRYEMSHPAYSARCDSGMIWLHKYLSKDEAVAEKALAMMLGYKHYYQDKWPTYDEAIREAIL